ncbi:MAG: 3-deoxy-manno-octulosonate cytidylyltransferase [Bacteroidales bacterium]|nr:3-deoxy-manno-octulosonate cytidylyltransferase [Bacteroidales bacterium]
MKILAVIPARYASSRFEGKPLAMINRRPMVIWVYDAAVKSSLFDKVCIATDDDRIYQTSIQYGADAVMTDKDLNNGTERCRQCVEILEAKGEKYDIVVNVQGDEPLIKPQMMADVISGFDKEDTDIVTLRKAITQAEQAEDKNVVKVVCAGERALYFSRSTVPFCRDCSLQQAVEQNIYYKHIGIYAYRTQVLKQIVKLKPTVLEQTEKLEQLRWLENGYNITVKTTLYDTVGVDTPQDLEQIKKIINNTRI